MTPDHINAVFEGGGAVLLCLNVRRLYQDKRLQGVSLVPTVWWNIWGFWNVYYYAALVQPLSFWAGIGVVTLNTIWVGLALYYRHKASAVLPPVVLRTCKLRCPGGSECGTCECASPLACPHGVL